MSVADADLLRPRGRVEPPGAPIRVLMVGESTMFRAGIGALVKEAGLEVAGEGTSLADGLQHLNGSPADIMLVVTLDAPDLVVRTLEEARQSDLVARPLIVTMRSEPELVERLVLAGARGVVFGDTTAEQLLTAIRRVHEGELWVDRSTTARIIFDMSDARRVEKADPEQAKIASLTPRERELMNLVATGLSNKAIATRMKISDSTVRHHLTSIFGKVHVGDRLGLVIYAFRHHLVPQTK